MSSAVAGREDGPQVALPTSGPGFWGTIITEYCAGDRRRFRYVAMLALREQSGWTLEMLGQTFGHPKGHVSRILRKVTRDLQRRFRPDEGTSRHLAA